MAKCVRVVGQGIPIRLSDEDAFQLVDREHDGEYCSKFFYKNWYKGNSYYEGKHPGLQTIPGILHGKKVPIK